MSHLANTIKHDSRSGSDSESGTSEEAKPTHDPERTPDNVIYQDMVGVGKVADAHRKVLTDEHGEFNAGKKVRNDAVIACEAFIYHSADADVNPKEFGEKAHEWACEQFGAENILHSALHVDETTPHVHVSFVPVSEKGTLSAKAVVGGREKLRGLQTSLAEKMAPLGLERGNADQGVKHQDLKTWHKKMLKASVEEPAMEIEPKKTFENAKEHVEQANEQLEGANLRMQKAEEKVERLEKELKDTKQTLNMATNSYNDMKQKYKELANQVRPLDLKEVMETMGYEPKREDPNGEIVYETEKGHVAINPEKGQYTMNWEQGKGGKGAIDLTCELKECKPMEAILWLSDKKLSMRACTTYGKDMQTLGVTVWKDNHQTRFHPEKEGIGREYLKERGISENVIDQVFKSKLVGVNKFGAVVFPFTDDKKKIKGAKIRGTKGDFKGGAGSPGEGGWDIRLEPNFGKPPSKIIVTESPIDALALLELVKDSGENLIISSSTNASINEHTKKLVEQYNVPLVCAFDNDYRGNSEYRKNEKLFTGGRISPPKAIEGVEVKDWADVQLKKSEGSNVSKPMASVMQELFKDFIDDLESIDKMNR